MKRVNPRVLVSALILISISCLLSATKASAAILDQLTPDQRAQVLGGQQLVLTEKVSGYPWPKTNVYEFIPCTPEEAEAITMDYNRRASYTKDVKLSQVSKVINPTTKQVDYIVHVPVLGDEHFTLQDHVSTYNDGQSFALDYHLVRADRAKTSDGLVQFEAVNGGTIMSVYTFIDPGIPLAKLVTGKAVRQAADAADAFVKHVIDEKTNQPALVQAQLTALRQALNPAP